MLIAFLSKGGGVVKIQQQDLQYCDYLGMLFRRSHDDPIKTDLDLFDLRLIKVILEFNCYPCPHNQQLTPHDFSSFFDLEDFAGLHIENEDASNDHLNEFLEAMDLELDPGDELVDEFDGLTEREIERHEKELERQERQEKELTRGERSYPIA